MEQNRLGWFGPERRFGGRCRTSRRRTSGICIWTSVPAFQMTSSAALLRQHMGRNISYSWHRFMFRPILYPQNGSKHKPQTRLPYVSTHTVQYERIVEAQLCSQLAYEGLISACRNIHLRYEGLASPSPVRGNRIAPTPFSHSAALLLQQPAPRNTDRPSRQSKSAPRNAEIHTSGAIRRYATTRRGLDRSSRPSLAADKARVTIVLTLRYWKH